MAHLLCTRFCADGGRMCRNVCVENCQPTSYVKILIETLFTFSYYREYVATGYGCCLL